MIFLFLIGACLAIFSLIYYYFQWCFNYWQRRGVFVPFQPSFPLGNLTNPFSKKKGLLDVVVATYDASKGITARYGGCYLLQSPYLVVVDPEILRLIMAKDFHIFHDRGDYFNEEKNPLSGHLFNISGTRWKYMRAKMTPTFTSGKMKMMFNTLIECGGALLESVEKCSNKPIDIKEVLGNFTTDIIGSCAFGLECSSFAGKESDFRKHGKNFFNQSLRARLVVLFGNAFPKLAKKLELEEMDSESIEFFMNVVKNNIDFREKNNYRRDDFFQLLMDIKQQSEEKGSDTRFAVEEFAAQVFVFFLAGFETSSTTMTFALYELAKHQDIQKRVREEINNVLSQHDGKLTYDATQDMKYLKCVIDEALRMYPPGAILARMATQNYKIPNDPLTIQKGIRCIVPIYCLHRDPDHFPKPDFFIPERFNEENKANIKPFTYLPFGEGPRNCIGIRFGVMESKVGLAILLKHFEFFPSSKTQEPLQYNPESIVLAAKGEIWLTAKKINNT